MSESTPGLDTVMELLAELRGDMTELLVRMEELEHKVGVARDAIAADTVPGGTA